MNNEQLLTAEERRELEELRAFKRKQDEANERKRERAAYYEIVDDAIDDVLPTYQILSGDLRQAKGYTLYLFRKVIEMKRESMGLAKVGQFSHTFTHSDGSKRIKIGMHITDAYRDTVEEGIEKVTNYIRSLADSERSSWLVDAVMKLLAKDNNGNLKASRVMQLRKLAEDAGSEEMIEGVRIIEESYLPSTSKMYVRVEIKDSNNAWVNIPLSVTDVDVTENADAIITGVADNKTEE